MDLNRKKARGDRESTEISDLPDKVIENILDRLPLGDAVRTSILSRKWWHHWKRLGNLVFDEKFINDEIRGNQRRDGEMLRSIYSDTVGTVLLLHSGPVNKFVLYVPAFCSGTAIEAQISKWMQYVSRSGVKDHTVAFPTKFGGTPKPLPSYVFHCQQLRRLSLHNCKAYLPSYFTGFSNLVSLHLFAFSADGNGINVLISSCPLLENLYLAFFKGPLGVSALRLKTLEANDCTLEGLTMQNVPNLVTASFRFLTNVSVQPRRIETFFDPMPNIESITLGADLFNVMDQHNIPKTLSTP